MPSLFSRVVLALLFLVGSTGLLSAQTPVDDTSTDEASPDETRARIEALVEELAKLLDDLPPEEREAVIRSLRERPAEPAEPVEEPPPLPPARPPAPEPEPAPEPQPDPESESAPRPALRCELIVPLDSDGNRLLTAFDRYWRHLYLWTDVDEDGDLDERELESPYERGIREIDLGLRSFVRGKEKRQRRLEITIEEAIVFDVGGDGYGGPVPRRDDGALVLDATAVREAGGPDLRDESGEPLVGFQVLRPGQRWILPDGTELVPRCR